MRIATKMTALLLFVLLGSVALGLWNLASLLELKRLGQEQYEKTTLGLGAVSRMEEGFLLLMLAGRDLIEAPDATAVEAGKVSIETARQSFQKAAAEYSPFALGEEKRAALEDVMSRYAEYSAVLDQTAELMLGTDSRAAFSIMSRRGRPLSSRLLQSIQAAVGDSEKEAEALVARSEKMVTETIVVTSSAVAVTFVLVLASGFLLTSSVVRRLRQVIHVSHELSERNLDLGLYSRDLAHRDELGELFRAFDRMMRSQSESIHLIAEVGSRLAGASRELQSAMTVSSHSASRISTSIDQVSSQVRLQGQTVTVVSSSVAGIQNSVTGLDSLVEKQSQAILQASSAVEELVANMRSIGGNLETMSNSFAELKAAAQRGRSKLVESSAKIDTIASQAERLLSTSESVREIAAQTNLLAMNAAIEAAHAGRNGAGFAVVAGEVRRLAVNAASKADEISANIQTILASISAGSEASSLSRQSFEDVLLNIENFGQIEREIRVSIGEQSQGSDQILETVTVLTQVSDSVVLRSSEIIVAAGSIGSQMDELGSTSRVLAESIESIQAGAREIESSIVRAGSVADTNTSLSSALDKEVSAYRLAARGSPDLNP